MSMWHATYLAYGLHVPVDAYGGECDRADETLGRPAVKRLCPDVGHLTAGGYDEDMFFLVAKVIRVELGNYLRIGKEYGELEAGWDCQLREAVQELGYTQYTGLEEPGWLVIPDVS